MSGAPLTWGGGRLDGTPWQGIRYLSIDVQLGTGHPVTVTAHLNQPAGALTPDDVVVAAGGGGVPPHDVTIGSLSIAIRFRELGGHSPHTVTLVGGGDPAHPIHPFFASAEFRFTIGCDDGDCRPAGVEVAPPAAQPPAVDLLTKDFTGFVRLLADWVKVRHPHVTDLTAPSFERTLLDLLAWFGDMTSYYQDRVANEAFLDTASQRFSLRQHAVLLGTALDDGQAATTVLAFEPTVSGYVPAGLQVRARTASGEVPVTFTVAARTRVLVANRSGALVVAAFPGAADAVVPAGARSVLVWGHGAELAAGDRLAFVQGSFSQVVTVAGATRRTEVGWVSHPSDTFDPGVDPPAEVTEVRWDEPLAQQLRPWSGPAPLRLHANLVDAVYGTPRRAVGGPGAHPRRDEVALRFDRRSSIVTRTRGTLHLRALRVPEWPVVHDPDPGGRTRPAVEVTVSGDRWARVDDLHASQSYDLHHTAEADEDGAVWLRFGDGARGHEIPMLGPGQPAVDIEVTYRIGDPVTGNVGVGTLVEIVRPPAGTDDQAALDALGEVWTTNVVPGSGGRRAAPLARVKEELPWSLRHGPLQRAVSLQDYAVAAMQVPGTGRATARLAGGPFNTVTVLVDPQGSGELPEDLRRRVHAHLDRLRMAGREHVVLAAEYVPLDVELVLCARQGVAPHALRRRVQTELEPGSASRPGWFHPDRLTFGSTVRLGDLLAFVQGLPGVQAVKASAFRPLDDTSGPAVRDVIALGRTKVARLDADPDEPGNGRLRVLVSGLDADAPTLAVGGRGGRGERGLRSVRRVR